VIRVQINTENAIFSTGDERGFSLFDCRLDIPVDGLVFLFARNEAIREGASALQRRFNLLLPVRAYRKNKVTTQPLCL
jgi:hypothetical protein